MEDVMSNMINDDNKLNHTHITVIVTISKLINREDALLLLCVNESTLDNLMARNEIRFLEIDGKIYFDENSLWEWMFKNNPVLKNQSFSQYDVIKN